MRSLSSSCWLSLYHHQLLLVRHMSWASIISICWSRAAGHLLLLLEEERDVMLARLSSPPA